MRTFPSLPAFVGLLGILVSTQASAAYPLVSTATVAGAVSGSIVNRLVQNPATGDLYAAGSLAAGAGNLNIWVGRYSSSLVLLSSYTYDKAGFDDAAYGIAVDTATSDVFVTGYVSSVPALSGRDVWLARFSSSLVLQSTLTVNGSANDRDEGTSVLVSSSVVYLVGISSQTGGKGVWLANYDTSFVFLSSGNHYQNNVEISEFVRTAGGTFVVGGRAPSFGVSNDQWIGKFTPNHVFVASAALNGPSGQTDHLNGVAEDGSGGVFAVGFVYTGTLADQYIARYDSNLVRIASHTVNGPGNANETLMSIVRTSSGTYLISGSYAQVAGLGGINAYIAEYDSSLNKISSTSFTTSGSGSDTSVMAFSGANGDVYAAGYMTPGASQDMWLARFSTTTVALPSTPASLAAASVGIGAAKLSWTSGGNPAGAYYQIERSTGAAFGLRQSSTSLSYTDALLSPGATFYYRVRALNAELAASAYTSTISVAGLTAPLQPVIASFTPSQPASGASVSAAAVGIGFDLSASLSLERSSGSAIWVTTGSFAQARQGVTITKLRDGRALLVGGNVEGSTAGRAEADLFSLTLGTWNAASPMNQGRFQHSAVMLADGRVLVTGGQAPNGTVTATAEVYDPSSGAWTYVASMAAVRKAHRAVLLPNGKVLVVGGYDNTVTLATAELYDPALDAWTAAASITGSRMFPVAATLADGKVLIAGGRNQAGTQLATSYLYDYLLDSWSATGSMSVGRSDHWSATLPDGKVLAAGGLAAGVPTNTADVFDPASSTWTATGTMSVARRDPALVLYKGQALVIGGETGAADHATTEFYNPATNAWTAGPSLTNTRTQSAAAVALDDGGVLIAGGRRGLGGGTTLNSAERLAGPVTSIAATGVSSPDAQHVNGTVSLLGAATGYWDVVVRQSGGRVGRLAGGALVGAAVPLAPSAFAGVAQSSTSILWSWTDNSSDETGFRVKLGGANLSGDLAAGATTWLQTGLTANATSGALLAQVFNSTGSADSALATVYALSDPPNSITATYFGSSVAFTWPTMTNPPGTLWSVERATDGLTWSQLYYSSAAAAYTDAGLSAGTTYYYRVRSTNGDGTYSFHANSSAIVYTGGAMTKTWVGLGLTFNASEAANWSPAFAPSANDSFVFNGASTKTCLWDSTSTINSLSLNAGFDGWASVNMSTDVFIGSVQASTGFLALSALNHVVTVTGDVVFAGNSIPKWDRGRVRLMGGLRIDSPQSANFTVSAATTTLEFAGAAFHLVTGTGSIQLPFVEITGSSDVYIGGSGDAAAKAILLTAGRLVLGTSNRLKIRDWVQTGGQFVAGDSTVSFWATPTEGKLMYVAPLAGNPFRNIEIGFGTNGVSHLKALGPLAVTGGVTITTGSFDANGFTHVIEGDWQELGGPTVASGGTIRFTGGRNVFLRMASNSRFPNLTVDLACSTCSLTAQANTTIDGALTASGATAFQAGAFSHRVRGNIDSPSGRILVGAGGLMTLDGGSAQSVSSGSNNFYDLVVTNPFGVSLAGAASGLNVQRHLDVRAGGRLDLTSDSIAVGGSLISSGTLNTAGSTITLSGAVPQTIQANGAAFQNLIVANASSTTFASSFTAAGLAFSQGGGALVFAAGSTFTVAALDLGASVPATRLRLRSSAPGAAWRLNVTGTASVFASDVQDSDASAGAEIVALSPTNLDGGGNVNWTFNLPVPAGLAASGVGQGAASLSWTSGGNAGGTVYQLERSTGTGFGLRQSSVALSFTDALLSQGATYYYRVRALNPELVASAYTSSITVVALTTPVYPALASVTPVVGESGASVALAVVGTGFAASALSIERPSAAPVWVTTASFTQPRQSPSITRLRDGRALLAGGVVEGSSAGRAEADLFSLVTGTWAAAAPMNLGRFQHAAVMLADGRVLVTGGQAPDGTVTATSEIYDPASGAWTSVAPMSAVRKAHRAVLLPNGKVLVVGGYNNAVTLATAEIFDPALNAWSAASSITGSRMFPVAASLANGNVLIAGGRDQAGTQLSTSYIYDYSLDSWSATGAMSAGRSDHWSATLPNGKVLAAGGLVAGNVTNTADVFDPATSTWTATGAMSVARRDPALVLYKGQALVIGGETGAADHATTELYDPASNAWTAGPSLTNTRTQTAAAVVLDDGGVLIAGGRRGLGGGTTLNSAERLAGPVTSIAATGVSIPDAQHVDGAVSLAGAATGYWDVVVRQAGGKVGRLPGGLLVGLAPAAPAAFAGVAQSDTAILWSWTDNASDEAGFRVLSGVTNVSGDLAAGATTWLQSGIAANTSFGPYTAAAFNGFGYSTSAASSRFTLAAVPGAPAAASVALTSATISWSASGNAAGTVYELERSTGTGYGRQFAGAATSYFDGYLTAGGTHYFRVRALNGEAVATAYSAISTVTALAPPPAPGAAGTPVGAALGTSSASWTWVLASGATNHFLFRPSDNSVIGSSPTGPFVQAALSPNTAYGLRVAGVNEGGTGPLSPSGTVYTLAAAPTGGVAISITSTSLVASWGLAGNPAGTNASLERSTDAIAYSTLAAVTTISHPDADLLGCTTYYYRVRNLNGDGIPTAYASFQGVTANTTPSPPSGLTASANEGGTIALSWGFSPTEGVAGYRLFWDAGTGTVSYAAPIAILASTHTSYTTGVLTSSAAYTFALRTVHRCNVTETTGALAMSGAATAPAEVRAAIKEPDSGRRVNGNRVTILAELIAGTPGDVQQVLFQYKAAAATAWTDVVPANINHSNPDFSFPYFVHVDVTVLAAGDYDLRAVAYNTAGVPDPAPPAVRVVVDPITPDISETLTIEGKIKKDQTISNTVSSVIDTAGAGAADPAVRVTIPVGVVNSATATVSVTANPVITTAAPAGQSLVGSAIKINLSNGQSALNGTAEITLTYPDTVLFPSLLQIYYLNEVTGQWSRDFNSTVDTTSRTVTGRTPHFSTFAIMLGTAFAADLSNVRVYPVPFKPNGGNPDEGKAFSAGDPNSGIIFANMAAGSEIRIYTLSGRLVASLDSPSLAGTVRWDARNQDGRDVASGAYFAVISAAGQKNVVKKIVIIR